jgi:hypothetical protein
MSRFEEAWPLLAEAVTISRRLGNQQRLIAPLNLLGDIACIKGDYEAAETFFQESLEISRALNDLYNQAILLNNLATVYQAKQQYNLERAVFEASLPQQFGGGALWFRGKLHRGSPPPAGVASGVRNSCLGSGRPGNGNAGAGLPAARGEQPGDQADTGRVGALCH